MSEPASTLITSGTYIGEEMQAEFGRIPPAFLPVGPSYLVQHQLRRLGGRGEVWLSLPADYAMDGASARLLEDERVRIIRIDPSKSLGMSVFQSILEIGPDRPLEIVHGDTLIARPKRRRPTASRSRAWSSNTAGDWSSWRGIGCVRSRASIAATG